jgi:NAD kinase
MERCSRRRRAAAACDAPVLGVACGSLGALSAVSREELLEALDRFGAGDSTVRSLPALVVRASGAPDDWAVNNCVVVRRGSGQIAVEVAVDGELYVRRAGDGLAVGTPSGSSAYSIAAGGLLLAKSFLIALRTTAGTTACAGLAYQPSHRIAFPESRPAQPGLAPWPRKRKRGIRSRCAT